MLPHKAKRQYLLTCKVSRYCLLDLQSGIARPHADNDIFSHTFLHWKQFSETLVDSIKNLSSLVCFLHTIHVTLPFIKWFIFFLIDFQFYKAVKVLDKNHCFFARISNRRRVNTLNHNLNFNLKFAYIAYCDSTRNNITGNILLLITVYPRGSSINLCVCQCHKERCSVDIYTPQARCFKPSHNTIFAEKYNNYYESFPL